MPTQQKVQLALDIWDVLSLMFVIAFAACPALAFQISKSRRR